MAASAFISEARFSGSPTQRSPFTPLSLRLCAYGVQSLTPAAG